jgi:hypothetical protein
MPYGSVLEIGALSKDLRTAEGSVVKIAVEVASAPSQGSVLQVVWAGVQSAEVIRQFCRRNGVTTEVF